LPQAFYQQDNYSYYTDDIRQYSEEQEEEVEQQQQEQQQEQQQQGWTAADPFMQARMRQKISRFSDLVSTIQRSYADADPYAPRPSSSQQGQQQTRDPRRRRRATRPPPPQDTIINYNNNDIDVKTVPPLTRVDRSPRTTVPREVEIVVDEGMTDMMMMGMVGREEDGLSAAVLLQDDLQDEGYYNEYSTGDDDDNGVIEMEMGDNNNSSGSKGMREEKAFLGYVEW